MAPDEMDARQHPPEPTLLPLPLASVVSLVTRSSSLYIRLGCFIGGLAIDGARATTLTSLELSRAFVEGLLNRAGKDVSTRSGGELGRLEAESLLETSLARLHSTMTFASFAASTGFQISTAALAATTDISHQLLTTLDSILGSTDSSRAIASIVTLIRREFQDPATGRAGEKVGVTDLLIGICSLALLQRWSRKLVEAEQQTQGWEQVIWDVVILDNGRRGDVDFDSPSEDPGLSLVRSGEFIPDEGIDEPVQRDDNWEHDAPEQDLKQRIMQSLPAGASVSIMTSSVITKTLVVEVSGAEPLELSLPAGVEVVERNVLPWELLDYPADANDSNSQFSCYRTVYRITERRSNTTRRSPSSSSLENEGAKTQEISTLDSLEPQSPVSLVEIQNSSELLSGNFQGDEEMISPASKNVVYWKSPDTVTKSKPSSILDLKNMPENLANQKKSRKPIDRPTIASSRGKLSPEQTPPQKKAKNELAILKPGEKKGAIRNAFKRGTATNLWNKDQPADKRTPALRKKPSQQAAWNTDHAVSSTSPRCSSPISIGGIRRGPAPSEARSSIFTSQDLGYIDPFDIPRNSSRQSYYSVHEQNRDSIISQEDTFSICSTVHSRPSSPMTFRAHLRTQSNVVESTTERNALPPRSPSRAHRRAVPSIYTLNTNDSNTSLVLSGQRSRGFQDSTDMDSFIRTGRYEGLFPENHIVRNMTRFVRFASASYGSSFLRVMGIKSASPTSPMEFDTDHHHEHHSFSAHTQLPPNTILLSSFVDPHGGTDSAGFTNTGVPMVHFVSIDHVSKAVVLTCRGTLGFEDVLTDMTCDYDNLIWQGKSYKVHKGIHASARRLLSGSGGRILATIKAALEEFLDYGLVLCGHSLGGGVAAILAILISEPATHGLFVTTAQYQPELLTPEPSDSDTPPIALGLPPGRPIHVYAYGPPATVSPSLRLATLGLITTVVNGQDLVPYLSLGVLRDLQGVALAFKTDDSGAKEELQKKIWMAMTTSLSDRWYGSLSSTDENDQWAYSALKTLRASMLSSKLTPPGEVFVIESMPVLKRHAFLKLDNSGQEGHLGRPATRSVLKYIPNVESRFGQVQFGGSMLLDHSPKRYEASLGVLDRGILNEYNLG